MEKNIFERTFDIHEYTKKRLLEMKNLEDRNILKELLQSVIVPHSEYIEDSYKKLEKKIFDEVKTNSDVSIRVGIVQKSEFDITDENMFPLSDSEVEDTSTNCREISKAIDEKGSFLLKTLFLKEDYLICKELLDSKRTFSGVIRTIEGNISIVCKIDKNQTCLDKLHNMHDVFSMNYLEWYPICAPYLHKMFDIHILEIDYDGEVDIEVLDCYIDFMEFSENVYYDQIPICNVTTQFEKASSYPEPCVDKKNYDHKINSSKLDSSSNYLVANTEIYIGNIRMVNGDLIISTESDELIDFNLIRIADKGKASYKEVIFSNEKKESFISIFKKSSIKTKGEINRIINSFTYDEYLIFEDCKVSKSYDADIETYDTDAFIKDEIRDERCKSYLILEFICKKKSYLTRDIMSFLVSNVGKFFPEYICIGKLNEKSNKGL